MTIRGYFSDPLSHYSIKDLETSLSVMAIYADIDIPEFADDATYAREMMVAIPNEIKHRLDRAQNAPKCPMRAKVVIIEDQPDWIDACAVRPPVGLIGHVTKDSDTPTGKTAVRFKSVDLGYSDDDDDHHVVYYIWNYALGLATGTPLPLV